jgi:putative transposase
MARTGQLAEIAKERNHQGKGNGLLFPRNEEIIGSRKGRVRCKERLGGLLKYYHREAARVT